MTISTQRKPTIPLLPPKGPTVRVPQARLAVGQVKVVVEARGRGVDREEAAANPLHSQERPFEMEVAQGKGEGQWGTAKRSMKIVLSRKFQSVTVEAGIELPWFIRTGEGFDRMRADAVKGFAVAKELVEVEFAKEFGDIDAIMDMVVERSGR